MLPNPKYSPRQRLTRQKKNPSFFFSAASSASPLNYKALVIKSTLGRSLSSTPLSFRRAAHVHVRVRLSCGTVILPPPNHGCHSASFRPHDMSGTTAYIVVMFADTKWNANESHIHHRVPESIPYSTYYHSVPLCQLLAARKYHRMTVASFKCDVRSVHGEDSDYLPHRGCGGGG